MDDFRARLLRLMSERGKSYRQLAGAVFISPGHLHGLTTGRRRPSPELAALLDLSLHASGELVAAAAGQEHRDDTHDAQELAARLAASDVAAETLDRLEAVVDDLAGRYVATDPAELLPVARHHLAQVRRLVDARATLAQQRRLLIAAGWLSLIVATVQIDLRDDLASEARLRLADQLGAHTGHDEIRAWALETRAWRALTAGAHRRALTLARQAQSVAPAGSSALAQATAQEGRVLAQLGRPVDTRRVLDRLDAIVAGLPAPVRPEHHYQYDPANGRWYTAAMLAWSGDPAGEAHAREILGWLEAGADGVARPRRIVGARLDLSLALALAEPVEAAIEATAAITTGWVVPSNWWRATEVLVRVEATGVREVDDLRDAYREFAPAA